MKKSLKKNQVPADRDPLHPEKMLVTRRDFLSSGVKGFSGAVVLPSVLEMVLLERAARAGVCPSGGAAPGMIPFLIFDCAGGASLPGNWTPLDAGGNPLTSYSTLGLGQPSQFAMDKRFGHPMAAQLPAPPGQTSSTTMFSQIFAALTDPTQLPAAAAANLQMGVIPATSLSDSGINTFSPISLISAAGLQGSQIVNGLGMTAAPSGGNSDWMSSNPTRKPLQVNSADALTLALSYGPAFSGMSSGLLNSLANALINLSGSQAAALSSKTLGDQMGTLASCGYVKNANYTAGVSGVDPRQDADAQSIFGITAGSSGTDRSVVLATLALNAVMGNSGPAVFTIGGCDYHDGTQTSGDNKDTEIGQTMAQALSLAYKKGKKVAFAVYTDGGIYSDDGTRNWRGDDNGHGLVVFGVMDPAAKPTMIRTQIGQYNAGQVCDPNFALGQNPGMIAHALFLNYLSVCGKTGLYSTIVAQEDARNTTLLTNPYPNLDVLRLF